MYWVMVRWCSDSYTDGLLTWVIGLFAINIDVCYGICHLTHCCLHKTKKESNAKSEQKKKKYNKKNTQEKLASSCWLGLENLLRNKIAAYNSTLSLCRDPSFRNALGNPRFLADWTSGRPKEKEPCYLISATIPERRLLIVKWN